MTMRARMKVLVTVIMRVRWEVSVKAIVRQRSW